MLSRWDSLKLFLAVPAQLLNNSSCTLGLRLDSTWRGLLRHWLSIGLL